LQLAHVARPRIRLEQIHGSLGEDWPLALWPYRAAGTKVLGQEMASQRRYIFSSLSQGREGNGKFIEPVKQAAEKGSRVGGSLQSATRSGNQPRGAVSVGVHSLQVSQYSQESQLGLGGEIVDAFKKDRSPFGQREPVEAWLRLGGLSIFPLTE
jgi:hypothetical protein